jgi:hypothetical protein
MQTQLKFLTNYTVTYIIIIIIIYILLNVKGSDMKAENFTHPLSTGTRVGLRGSYAHGNCLLGFIKEWTFLE